MGYDQLGFLPQSARQAFIDMAGNFDKSLSNNMLGAWARNLEGIDPAEVELACRRCVRDGDIEHFPRWHEFERKLPRGKADGLDPAKFFSPAPMGDGPWIGDVECLPAARRREIAMEFISGSHGHLTNAQVRTIEHLCPGLLAELAVKPLPGIEVAG